MTLPLVYFCEGEKDADSLAALGLVVTTVSGGSNKGTLEKTDLSPLHGRNVIAIADKDAPGRAHMKRLAAILHGKAASVKIVEVPGDDCKDASDWIARLRGEGKDDTAIRAAFEMLAGMAKAPKPPKPPKPLPLTESWGAALPANSPAALTDLGNARRLAASFADRLRYCWEFQCWLCWDGKRWTKYSPELARQAAMTIAETLFAEAGKEQDADRRKYLVSHALRSMNASGLSSMLDVARGLPGLTIKPAALDQDPWLLNVENGAVDLRTGELKDHDPDDYLTHLAPVAFDPSATCPQWLAFLKRSLPDQERIDFLQRALGYSLTGVVRERCMFVTYGGTQRGKTTVQETLATILGDYARTFNPQMLLITKFDQGRHEVAELPGVRFAVTSETNANRRFDEAKVKHWTGNEKISAEAKYERPFDFYPQFKLWMATNHRPEIRGTDDAIWTRLRVIPFDREIPPEEKMPDLREKLLAEAPGILAWAIGGCLAWQASGLATPKVISDAVDAYREDMDSLKKWLSDACFIDVNATVPKGELWASYLDWCHSTGEQEMRQRAYLERLRLAVPGLREYMVQGKRFWQGIGLVAEVAKGSANFNKPQLPPLREDIFPN